MDQRLGLVGKTGNSPLAHLHLDIFKKLPPNGNWRWYPKTKEQLDEYMVDPLWLIKEYKGYNGEIPEERNEDMTEELEAFLRKYGCASIKELDKKVYEHVGITWGDSSRDEDGGWLASERRKSKDLEKYKSFPEELAEIFGSTADIPTLKVTAQRFVDDDSVKDTVRKCAEDVKNTLVSKVKEAKDGIEGIDISTKAIEKFIKQKADKSEETLGYIQRIFTSKWITDLINKLFRR